MMDPSKPIQVVLADDHSMVREALARILNEDDRIEVVAQACNGEQVLKAVQENSADVLVLDYSMPDQDTPHVIDRLTRQFPQLKVLVLTVHENIHYAVRVLQAGAQGYLIKAAAADELLRAIKQVYQGQVYLSESLAQDVLQYLRQPKRRRSGLESLSLREFDFLRYYGSGRSLQDCATGDEGQLKHGFDLSGPRDGEAATRFHDRVDSLCPGTWGRGVAPAARALAGHRRRFVGFELHEIRPCGDRHSAFQQ